MQSLPLLGSEEQTGSQYLRHKTGGLFPFATEAVSCVSWAVSDFSRETESMKNVCIVTRMHWAYRLRGGNVYKGCRHPGEQEASSYPAQEEAIHGAIGKDVTAAVPTRKPKEVCGDRGVQISQGPAAAARTWEDWSPSKLVHLILSLFIPSRGERLLGDATHNQGNPFPFSVLGYSEPSADSPQACSPHCQMLPNPF